MTSHLDDGTIHELIDGEIASTALGPIRDHLAACAECRARLEAAQAVTDEAGALVEALDGPVAPARTVVIAPSPAARSNAWIRNAAWAASLAIAVGAGYYARGNPAGAVLQDARQGETRERPPAGDPLQAAREDALTPPPAPPTATTTSRAPAPVAQGAAAGATTGSERDAAERREATREVTPATGAAVAAEGRASAPARQALGEGVSIEVPDPVMRRTLNQQRAPAMLPRDQAVSKQANDAARADTISFTDAIRRLGGRLLLIEGMVPVRLEMDGSAVRVIYRVQEGELVLSQSVREGVVAHRLIAPPGFPADSVRALERRIKG